MRLGSFSIFQPAVVPAIFNRNVVILVVVLRIALEHHRQPCCRPGGAATPKCRNGRLKPGARRERRRSDRRGRRREGSGRGRGQRRRRQRGGARRPRGQRRSGRRRGHAVVMKQRLRRDRGLRNRSRERRSWPAGCGRPSRRQRALLAPGSRPELGDLDWLPRGESANEALGARGWKAGEHGRRQVEVPLWHCVGRSAATVGQGREVLGPDSLQRMQLSTRKAEREAIELDRPVGWRAPRGLRRPSSRGRRRRLRRRRRRRRQEQGEGHGAIQAPVLQERESARLAGRCQTHRRHCQVRDQAERRITPVRARPRRGAVARCGRVFLLASLVRARGGQRCHGRQVKRASARRAQLRSGGGR
mmetsp:Transcript_3495/g.14445  ORF Transcript_3495/g.14445 Transcript_3495/m.14445 type:complete len:360 (+) Transcript_3495:8005-9084(+)